MTKISKARVDLENARLEQAVLKRYHETVVTVDASATTTLDISSGNVFDLAHDIDITTLNVTNPAATGTLTSITIIRTKDNNGTTRLITWPAAFKWAGDTEPTLTQTANAVDVITAFTKDGGTTWFAFAAGLNMS
jgi:hypothetical protein